MADVTTATQQLTREQIAVIVGNNPRAIKLLENLLRDVSDTLPTAITDVELALRFSLQAADGSKSASFNALHLAEELANQLRMQRNQRADVDALRREVEDLRTLLQMTLTASQSAISKLRADLEDARTILQGA